MQCDGRHGTQNATGEFHYFFGTAKTGAGGAQSMREHFKVGLLVGRQHGKDVLFDAVSLAMHTSALAPCPTSVPRTLATDSLERSPAG